jgi:hypothetical protein
MSQGLMRKKSPAALFSDIDFVAGGEKRGFRRLAWHVATPGPALRAGVLEEHEFRSNDSRF